MGRVLVLLIEVSMQCAVNSKYLSLVQQQW